MNRCRLFAIVSAALALSLFGACGTGLQPDPVQAEAREHGIEILGVQLMADGNFARLNYRVVDYGKAKRSLKGEVRLVPEGADRPLPIASTSRLGPLRQRPTATGRPQFMLFTNYAGALRKGDRAVLEIGKGRIAGIPVS